MSAGVKSTLSPVMVIGTLTAEDMCRPLLFEVALVVNWWAGEKADELAMVDKRINTRGEVMVYCQYRVEEGKCGSAVVVIICNY